MGQVVEITEIDAKATPTYLHAHYDGQIAPQPCYVELDCDEGTLTADYSGEVGSGEPIKVWHSRTLRWSIPALKSHKANELLHEIAPLCQRILDGYESVWDGSNWTGGFTEDAEDARGDVYSLIDSYPLHDPDWSLVIWTAGDWLDAVGDQKTQALELEIAATSTDADLERIGKSLIEEATTTGDADGLTDVDDYLDELRGVMRELAEEVA